MSDGDMLPIPEARYRLLDLIGKHAVSDALADDIRDIVARMYRNPPAHPKTPRRCPSVDRQFAEEIRRAKARRPGLSNFELAKRFNTNQGRISEALNHLR